MYEYKVYETDATYGRSHYSAAAQRLSTIVRLPWLLCHSSIRYQEVVPGTVLLVVLLCPMYLYTVKRCTVLYFCEPRPRHATGENSNGTETGRRWENGDDG